MPKSARKHLKKYSTDWIRDSLDSKWGQRWLSPSLKKDMREELRRRKGR